MVLEEQEKDMSDDEGNIKLPGAKKIDVFCCLFRFQKFGRSWKLMLGRLLCLIPSPW